MYATDMTVVITRKRRVYKYGKGQVVLSQGDAGDADFYVQKGQVKVPALRSN